MFEVFTVVCVILSALFVFIVVELFALAVVICCPSYFPNSLTDSGGTIDRASPGTLLYVTSMSHRSSLRTTDRELTELTTIEEREPHLELCNFRSSDENISLELIYLIRKVAKNGALNTCSYAILSRSYTICSLWSSSLIQFILECPHETVNLLIKPYDTV